MKSLHLSPGVDPVADLRGGASPDVQSVVQWLGGNGDWSTSSDWSKAPTRADEAVIAAAGYYSVTISKAEAVGSSDITDYNAALAINAQGTTTTVVSDLISNGQIYMDSGSGQGGTSLKIGGALISTNGITFGNSNLDANTTITAASLSNSGTLTLWGGSAATGAKLTTLDVAGAAFSTLVGAVNLHGDALLEFASGSIQTIARSSGLLIDGKNARVSDGAGTTDTALSQLSTNYGTFDVEGATSTGPAGTVVATKSALNDIGYFYVDVDGSAGGSKVTLGGALTDSGTVTIGNSALSASTTVTVSSLQLTGTGNLTIEGQVASGGKNRAVLDVLSAAPTTLEGDIHVWGDSLFEFASGGIATIGTGAGLALDGSAAHVSIGVGTTDSALAKLSTNLGVLSINGTSPYGSGGHVLTTTVGLTNVGTLQVDSYGGYGGSSVKIGGALDNERGTVTLGNSALAANTSLTVSSLTNYGTVNLYGSNAVARSFQSTLDITGAAPTVLTGSMLVQGDADVEYASGGITTLAAGAELQIAGANARLSIGKATTNTALSTLSEVAGTLVLQGGAYNAPGGVSLKTTGALTNVGEIDADIYYGQGASALTIGGVLTNEGALNVGNTGLSGATKVSVGGLANAGTITLQGSTSGSTANLVTLSVATAAPSSLSGATIVRGDAHLSYASGSVASIAAGALLELDGAEAVVTEGTGKTNSALSNLSEVDGRLLLRGDAYYGPGGVNLKTNGALTVTGELDVDEYGGEGGSNLTVGTSLANSGTLVFGNTGLSATTVLRATSLANSGTMTLSANASDAARVLVSGAVTNTGSLSVGAYAVLDAAGFDYTQTGGTTVVAGQIEADALQDKGGVVNFTGAVVKNDGLGALDLYGGAEMIFGAAVDSTHTVTFEDDTGDLQLSDAADFAGTIAGFTADDVIDLAGVTVTKLTYAGHTLSVFNGTTKVASLTFSGTYTSASFAFVSDNAGGTQILDPGGAQAPAASRALVQASAAFGAVGGQLGSGEALHAAPWTTPGQLLMSARPAHMALA